MTINEEQLNDSATNDERRPVTGNARPRAADDPTPSPSSVSTTDTVGGDDVAGDDSNGAQGSEGNADGEDGKIENAVPEYDESTLKDIRNLGIYLAVLSVVLLVSTLALWPRTDHLPIPPDLEDTIRKVVGEIVDRDEAPAEPDSASKPADETPAAAVAETPSPKRILLLVVVVGLLGSVIGAISSFVSYVGNGTFMFSWLWWYLLRPLMGSMLGLLLYLVAQAGFLESPSVALDQGKLEKLIYQAVAIAGLAGMFSKLTADKLEQIFATILQSNTDKGRKHKLTEKDNSK